MRTILLYFSALLMAACTVGQEHHSAMLEKADSLLSDTLADSSLHILQATDTTVLDENELAFFYLLKAEASYKTQKPTNINQIQAVLEFYKEKGETEELVRAMLNMAYHFGDTKKDSAIYNAKQAEAIALRHKYDKQLVQIYRWLFNFNACAGNFHTAIVYGNKLLELAKRLDEKRHVGYALDELAVCYDRLGMTDSAKYYLRAEIPYVKYQPRKERPYFYNNISGYYYMIGDVKMQEYYLKQGVEAYPIPIVYGSLANFYAQQGNTERADSFWEKALQTDNLEEKIAFMGFYADYLDKQGRKDEYGKTSHQIILLKDSLIRKQEAERTKDIQNVYEQKAESAKWTLLLWQTVVVAFLVLSALLTYHLSRRRKLQKEIGRLGSLVNVNEEQLKGYAEQLENLRKKQGASQRKVKRLEAKMENLRNHQDELLAKGWLHFNEIMSGGRTVTWKKEDFISFVEYYGTEHSEFVMALNQQYDSLSASQKCFLVLFDMGKSEDEVSGIMNLTPSAMRMTRSRISRRHTA